MKPIIGIPQLGHDLLRLYLKHKYVSALKRAGAHARWIELEDPEQAAREVLECDGLLIPGGADVDPHLYGQEPTEKCEKPNVLRDAGEQKILEAFFPTGKPIFCICRGLQFLNVFCGGTLHQDIQHFQQVDHSDFKRRYVGSHEILVTPGTKISGILEDHTVVNSFHHQAVDALGEGLVVSAVSPDGIVEAVEHRTHPFCIGFQWHPEHFAKRIPAQQKLFDLFVQACK